MPIRPELLVRGLDGKPQPPHEIVARLKREDPRLGLFYTNAAWAITESWREDDPRRQWIQAGAVQPEMAFDICGYLPVTCALEEAPAYVERELKSYTAEQFSALRAAVTHWNDVGMGDALEDKVLGGVEDAMTKGGPSIGVFHVPVQLADNTAPAVPPPAADPSIAAAMSSRRRKRS